MSPRNFPERLNERRKAALAHLLMAGKKELDDAKNLVKKIKIDSQRSVKNKKDRSNASIFK